MESIDRFVNRKVHLEFGHDGLQDLRFEGGDTAVPEERLTPGAIHKRRHAARPTAPVDADGLGSAVGEGALGAMAVDAGERAVAREPSFPKQAAAERDRGGQGRVVSGLGPVQIQPKRPPGFRSGCHLCR